MLVDQHRSPTALAKLPYRSLLPYHKDLWAEKWALVYGFHRRCQKRVAVCIEFFYEPSVIWMDLVASHCRSYYTPLTPSDIFHRDLRENQPHLAHFLRWSAKPKRNLTPRPKLTPNIRLYTQPTSPTPQRTMKIQIQVRPFHGPSQDPWNAQGLPAYIIVTPMACQMAVL